MHPLALVRADASRTTGGGHVLRCSALAEELRARGWRVVLATSDETPAALPDLAKLYPEVLTGMGRTVDDAARIRNHIGVETDVAIVDHYGLDADYERHLRAAARRIVAIDDAPSRPHHCDVLVDTTLGRNGREYSGLVPETCTLLCGSAYAILRQAFKKLRRDAPERVLHGGRRRLLISFGLMDHVDATGKVLDSLGERASGIAGDVVLGAGAPFAPDVRRRIERIGPSWTFHSGIDQLRMAHLIAGCDLVVGAGGTSSYERCCLGKPAALIRIADNQAANVEALAATGAAVDLGRVENSRGLEWGDTILALLDDRERLDRMSGLAAAVTDGEGAGRIADALEPR